MKSTVGWAFLMLLIQKVSSSSLLLSEALQKTWNGLKERNINAYDVKLVHRPKSETPGDAVSEGVGYGMLVALYSDDQETFDTIWESAEQYMWNGRCYDWRVDEHGQRTATGAATDAEQDIALSLIFADRLVNQRKWKAHQNPTYSQRAQDILDNMWNTDMVSPSFHLAPGAGWGGDDFVNPGYFAPAWYRIFAEFDLAPEHEWYRVIDTSYDTIQKSPGILRGLVPDWMSPDHGFYEGSLGYNTYGDGKFLYKDAIRVFWRIGTDYLWFSEPRAREFLVKAYDFIESKGGPMGCNFYQMNGELVPHQDIWTFNGGQTHRLRQEHSPLTIGMWSIVPYVLRKPNALDYTAELLRYYEPNSTYWGLTNSVENIYQNEMYFEQFLAWFGAIVLNGTWTPVQT